MRKFRLKNRFWCEISAKNVMLVNIKAYFKKFFIMYSFKKSFYTKEEDNQLF